MKSTSMDKPLRTSVEISTESITRSTSLTLNIDFDGTCVTHAFPEVGRDIGSVPVLRELVAAGHRLILFTMRSDGTERAYLDEAVQWFVANGIPLYGVNTNPTQSSWTSSPKSYAQKMIDDSSVCAPLKFDPALSTRPFIDWVRMREMLVECGLLEDRGDEGVEWGDDSIDFAALAGSMSEEDFEPEAFS